MYTKIKGEVSLFCHEYLNKTACILACLHFAVSFFTDRLIFTYVLFDFSSPLMMGKSAITWFCKLAFLAALLTFYNYLYYLIKKAPREYVRFIAVYFALLLVLLFLTYPGIWRMDEFGILFTAQEAFFEFWQNYLTSLFYIVALMFCPFPVSVVLMQCFLISILTGSIIYQIRSMNVIRGKWIYAMYLPFLCLPVLDSNLYPMRMSLYAYFELYMLVRLVVLSVQAVQGRQLSWKDFASLFAVVPVVISLRTEALYYFAAFPFCFILLFRGRISRKEMTRVLCGMLAITMVLFLPQQIGSKMRNGNEYTLTSVVLPIVPLVYAAQEELADLTEEGNTDEVRIYDDTDTTDEDGNDISEKNAANDGGMASSGKKNSAAQEEIDELQGLLADIDKVIDVQIAITGYEQGKNGIALFWSAEGFRRLNYSDEEFQSFQKAYRKLVVRYPKVFLKERTQTFLESGDLLENTTTIYEDRGVPNHERFAAMTGNQAISTKVRNSVICFLELRRQGDYTQKLWLYPVVYHVMLPLILLTVVLIVLLAKRRWGYAALLAAHLCKVPLIFLTAPSRLFMYYYPVYLVGAFVAVFLVLFMCFPSVKHQNRHMISIKY